MPQITIGGQLIDFPNSGTSPNWAPAVVEFAQAVESALSGLAGAFDVPPQAYTMVANVNNNVDIPNLTFPTSDVRAAIINYAVERQTDNPTPASDILVQSGEIRIAFNDNNPTSNKWEIIHSGEGDALITFTVTDTGQIRFSTASMSGINHQGKITFSGKAILQS